jgi:carboxyl-terminal processing protease
MTDITGHDEAPSSRRPKKLWLAVPAAVCAGLAVWLAGSSGPALAGLTVERPPACLTPPEPTGPTGPPPTAPPPTDGPRPEEPELPRPGPTTVQVIGEAYYCVLTHYYGGSTMDHRPLLKAAFAGLVTEILRGGRDVRDAIMPALTGDRDADWAAFAAAYQRTVDQLPNDAGLRQHVAESTVEAMVRSLQDNHARWIYREPPPPGYDPEKMYGLGLEPNYGPAEVLSAPDRVTGPLYVAAVLGGAAKAAGLRAGDIIESVDGSAPFPNGIVSAGTVLGLFPGYPSATPVKLQIHRPANGRKWTVSLKPTQFDPLPGVLDLVTSKVLPGDVGYVRLAGFAPDAAERVFAAVAKLREGRTLKGLVLDLRANHGGSPVAVNRLLAGFAHDKVTAYQCDAAGVCETHRTDDSVPLLNLPLVVLADGGCASACDHFTAAVKDHGIAPIVGARTAGAVSGLGSPRFLTDGSVLVLPGRRHLGPNKEIIDTIGVPPDHYSPRTAKDLSTGRDPAVAKALTFLSS